MLGAAGRLLVATLGWGDLASMYAHKLAAFLFITNAESGDVFGLRTWRIATLILAAFGLAGMRDRWLRGVVAGVLAYQVVVHVPVLYQHRYSVGALDVWLAMLAGVGIAMLWERRRTIEMTAAACATLAGIMIGGDFAWNGGASPPQGLRGGKVVRLGGPGAAPRLEGAGARRGGAARAVAVIREARAALKGHGQRSLRSSALPREEEAAPHQATRQAD